MRKVAGFVLAGGRSSRMGFDKARLKMGGRFLVEIVAERLREAAGEVVLIGNPALFRDLPIECVPDVRHGQGPLGGLEAALLARRAERNLVVGCDMPDVQASDLAHLVATAGEEICTIAKDRDGRRHPLCAIYRIEALPYVQAALDAGRLRLLDLVEELKAVDVPISSVLSNLNTPGDWAAWQAAAQ